MTSKCIGANGGRCYVCGNHYCTCEPLGPDSFGGQDYPPAPSAETLRREMAEVSVGARRTSVVDEEFKISKSRVLAIAKHASGERLRILRDLFPEAFLEPLDFRVGAQLKSPDGVVYSVVDRREFPDAVASARERMEAIEKSRGCGDEGSLVMVVYLDRSIDRLSVAVISEASARALRLENVP